MAAHAYAYDEDFDDDAPTTLFIRWPGPDLETDSWQVETRRERPAPRRSYASDRLIPRTRLGTSR